MKKYRFLYPKSAFVIYALIVITSVVSIVFAALRLAEVGKYFSTYPALDVLDIVLFSIFIAVISLNLFCSYYAFRDNAFVVAQLFFRRKIPLISVRRFVIDEATGLAALYFEDPRAPGTLACVTVNLRKRDLDPFSEDLRFFIQDIVIEINPIRKEND